MLDMAYKRIKTKFTTKLIKQSKLLKKAHTRLHSYHAKSNHITLVMESRIFHCSLTRVCPRCLYYSFFLEWNAFNLYQNKEGKIRIEYYAMPYEIG